MGIYIADQTVDFLLSLPLGAVFGLFYDAFRILRIALPHKKWAVTLEDVLFWMGSAVATFFFLLGSVDGKVRFFLLAGMLLGATLYFQAVSPLVMGVSRAVIRVITGVMRWTVRFLLRPIWRILYALVSFFLRPFRFLRRKFKKLLQRFKYSLKKRRILLYNHLKGFAHRKKAENIPEDAYYGNEETWE